ncbi:glycosyltransferase [Nocardioides sp.]|uniref:CgeB family protein n=1 Tax=Nocardioides sp. TaxID=35761 RepID=UPI00286E9CF1|nr:glycosyltransferase [Nocardioides sp.]
MPNRVLVVSPAFHGIWLSLATALERAGFEVEHHLYDENAGLVAKARHHMTVELASRLGRSTDEQVAERLGGAARAAVLRTRPDVVVTIKGDVLGEPYWESLAGIPHVTWLYDQLDAMRFAPEMWPSLGGVGSFSHTDTERLRAAGLAADYVALAYDPAFEPGDQHSGGIVFAGARYPRREELLLRVQAAGVPVVAYGRSWSKHPYDRLRTWDLHRPDIPSGRELSRSDAHQVMRAADATINIHGAQDGFTLRTFEASGIGAVQLIDRADVSEFYEPGTEVLVYDGVDELVELCQRASQDHAWGDAIRAAARSRTLAEHTFSHRASDLLDLLD